MSETKAVPVTPTLPRSGLLATRVALCALFACFGITVATWAVHLPSLQRATGISTAMLGTVLLISGIGALVGMQMCGPLTDRFGNARVAVVANSVMALSVTVPLAATTPTWAAAGALVFGVAAGAADVSMNAAAVGLERAYARPILASFHGVFSMGNVLGSLLATVGFALHVATLTVAAAVAIGCVTIIAGVSRWLRAPMPPVSAVHAAPDDVRAAADDKAPSRAGRVLALGALAFLLLLSEGTAMDWSSLHAQQSLGAPPAWGTVAFGSFVTAMTLGRFCVDRIAHRIGPVAVVRGGSVVAAIGVTVVITAPNLPAILIGWLLFGLGLAGGMPQVFTAAGNVGAASDRALARVVGMGYVALMAGPALIGWVAEVTSLSVALLLPLCAVTVCGLAAAVVKPRK